MLQQLLNAGARVRTAIEPFSVQTSSGLTAFEAGTLLVRAGIQDEDVLPKVRHLLSEAALANLAVHSAEQTVTAVGPDFGSDKFALIAPIKPLLVGGAGISAYGTGEAWFTLDQRLSLATTIVESDRLGKVTLSDYTHLILPDGDYGSIDPEILESIREWAFSGGVVIAIARASVWVEGMCFEEDPIECEAINQAEASEEEPEAIIPRPYGSLADDQARLTIGGAIVETVIDLTHPLAFGFPRHELPVMRRGATVLTPSENAYSTPAHYADAPLLAGYVSEERLAEFAGGPALIAEKRGKGLIVRFANDPLFRGFWRGSERLFLNALFFGGVVEASDLPD